MIAQLDTSGEVETLIAFGAAHRHFMATWGKLSPFTQGYVETLLTPCEALHYSLTDRFAGFSDLAPETLSRIIADCERHAGTDAEDGRAAWWLRQEGLLSAFPPLTVQLGDDGKVHFAGADQ